MGFGWDIVGAAIATAIGNVIGAGYYIFYFVRGKSSLSISLKNFTVKDKDKVAVDVLVMGIPAALGSVLMSVSQTIINSQMAEYGDMAIAAMGVAMKVVMMTGIECGLDRHLLSVYKLRVFYLECFMCLLIHCRLCYVLYMGINTKLTYMHFWN